LLIASVGLRKEWSMLEKTTIEAANVPLKDKADVARKRPKPTATKAASRTVAGRPAASRGRQDDMHERVQRRAYELWESEGRPAGREHDHWMQAEREIASTRRQHAGMSR
jgi:Protein of unknown function (DUF2934)